MSELIVLGLIPGTQLQITFLLWMVLVIAVLVGAVAWLCHRARIFRNWLIAAYVLLLTRRQLRA